MDLLASYDSDDDPVCKPVEEVCKPVEDSEVIASPVKPSTQPSSTRCNLENVAHARSATAIVQMVRESLEAGSQLTFQLKTKALLGIQIKSTTKTREQWQTHKIVKDLILDVKASLQSIEIFEDVRKLDELSVCEAIYVINKLSREPFRSLGLKIFNLAEAEEGRNPLRAKSVCYLAHATKNQAVCEEALRRTTCNLGLIAQVAPKPLMPLVQEKLTDAKLDVTAEELAIIIRRMPQAFLASKNSNMLFESAVRKRPEFEDMGMWEAIQQLMERTRQKDFDSLLPELRSDGISRKRNAKGELNTIQQFHTQDGHSTRWFGTDIDHARPSPPRICIH